MNTLPTEAPPPTTFLPSDLHERIEEYTSYQLRPQDFRRSEEPVIFEPLPKIRITRGTYHLVIIKDLAPYEETLQRILAYVDKIKGSVETFSDWVHSVPEGFSRYLSPPLVSHYNQTYNTLVEQAKLMATMHRATIDQLEETHPSVLGTPPREVSANPYTKAEDRRKRSTPVKAREVDESMQQCIQDVHLLIDRVMTKQARRLSGATPRSRRRKRWLLSVFNTVALWRGSKAISKLKSKVNALIDQNELQEEQIQELAVGIKQTNLEVQVNRDVIRGLDVRLVETNRVLQEYWEIIGKNLGMLQVNIFFTHYALQLVSHFARVQSAMQGVALEMSRFAEDLRSLSDGVLTPVALPPGKLRRYLIQVKSNLRPYPRLTLPGDPEQSIWDYYSLIRLKTFVTGTYLTTVMGVPLVERTGMVNVYRVHNLPAFHPELKVQFTYELEGKYLAVTEEEDYVTIPSVQAMQVCENTRGYMCILRTALHPTEHNTWCIYQLFQRDVSGIRDHCSVNTEIRHGELAVHLGGFLWAISPLAHITLWLRCEQQSNKVPIRPPLTIAEIPNGCEGYADKLFIPARTDIVGEPQLEARSAYLQSFNLVFQDPTRYTMWESLGLPEASKTQLELLTQDLADVPPMEMKYLKQRIKKIGKDYPWTVSPNVVLFALIASVVIGVGAFAVGLYHFKGLRGKVLGTFGRVVHPGRDEARDQPPRSNVEEAETSFSSETSRPTLRQRALPSARQVPAITATGSSTVERPASGLSLTRSSPPLPTCSATRPRIRSSVPPFEPLPLSRVDLIAAAQSVVVPPPRQRAYQKYLRRAAMSEQESARETGEDPHREPRGSSDRAPRESSSRDPQ